MKQHHKDLIDSYVKQRCHVGSAFQSIIEGKPAIWKLDSSVKANLAEILEYVQWNVPKEARGTREKYKAWCGHAENIPEI